MEPTVMKIDVSNVFQVYSGKQGKCCCGCSGKHTYHSIHRELAPDYVKEDDADFGPSKDRVVRQIVRKIEDAALFGRVEFVRDEYVSAENEEGTRVWVAYFAKPDAAFVEKYGHLDRDEIKARKQAEAKLAEVATDLAWERSAQVMC
jgi:hypothetical protein